MGVNPTPTNYKALTFGGSCSRNYGVYITGEGVFNAPERAIEMVSIPGRNGAFALDKGRFENIEVTYPAGIVADSHADFAKAISDFRNVLCSKNGYVRLEDEYNTGEYRLAIYKSGLEVSHEGLQTGEFDVTFECKPQRFLTSGETAVAVASGGKVTNPTLFEARPQLQVNGYGEIDIEGQTVTIENALIGNVTICEASSMTKALPSVAYDITLDASALNSGDTITFDGLRIVCKRAIGSGVSNLSRTVDSVVNANYATANGGADVDIKFNPFSFYYGTAFTDTMVGRIILHQSYSYNGTPYAAVDVQYALLASYDGSEAVTFTAIITHPVATVYSGGTYSLYVPDTIGDSTKSALGTPTYIDLDIGECWKEENGTPVSVNNAVILPAELPVLVSGENTITYDNTITQFKVLPRWWKV